MELSLQIALGVIPAFLLILFSALIVHKRLVRKIITLILLSALGISAVLFYFQRQAAEETTSKSVSTNSLDLVYAVLASGDTDKADELLTQITEEQLYLDDYALCSARIQALYGNYTASFLLYQKAIEAGLTDDGIQEEYELITACLSDEKVDSVLYSHMSEEYIPDVENYSELIASAEAARSQVNEILSLAISARSEKAGTTVQTAAEQILQADQLYTRFLNGEQISEEETTELLTTLNKLSKKTTSLSAVRLAWVKAELIAGNYADLAKNIDEESDYNELMVISELYLNGYVGEDDFSKSFGKENIAIYKAVQEQLQAVYDEYYLTDSATVRKQVRAVLEELKNAIENPALTEIQKMLGQYAESGSSSSGDASKIYMQLSRLSQQQGSEVSANQYLTNALNTVGSCRDSDYTEPVCEIVNILNDKEDISSLKAVSQYAQEAISHVSTLPLSDDVKNSASDSSASTQKSSDFANYVSDYVSQKRASIRIISLNADNFETEQKISLVVSVDSDIAYTASSLQNILALKDCGADITQFTVEDISYDKANIVLVCDTSGSMAGNAIENLKNAVSLFIENQTDKENIGLVVFTSQVSAVYGLDSTVDQLNEAVSKIYASGGTNMYDAVLQAMSMFNGSDEDQSLDVIILLSDGNDNSPHSTNDISTYIGIPCKQQDIILYSIGLGSDVDENYLDAFATGTGGSYLYAADSQTLASFYEYLHNMIVNRYKITFTAVDTFSTERTVRVHITEDELAYDTKNYSLYHDEDYDLTTQYVTLLNDKAISGLDTRMLYTCCYDQTINLLCSGFSQEDNVTVTMKGKLSYSLKCTFVSESRYELIIPSTMAAGTYDMIVTVNGNTAYFEKELVLGDEESITVFGPYTFTSTVKETGTNRITLSGYVCLNGWLYFNGTVTLTGNLEQDTSITMTDNSGCYIQYSVANSSGLAAYLAEKNQAVSIGTLGTVTLYNDTLHAASSDDYRVDPIVIPAVSFTGVLTMSTPGLSLYPDRIVINMNEFTTKFPKQDDILKKAGVSDIFSFDIQSKVTLTNKNIGLYLKTDVKSNTKQYTSVNLGSMPIYVNPAEFELVIDTLKSNYSIKFMVRLAFVEADGIGIKLAWSSSLVPTEVRLYCDIDLETTISGVPVTFSDFELAAKDITTSQSPLSWTFEGVTKISVAKVSSVLPGLQSYVGDVSFFALDKTTLSFSLSQKYIKLSSKGKLFDKVEVGSVELECGKLSYTNQLLDMEGEAVSGMRAKLAIGILWESDNCDIDLSGSAELMISDKYIGVTVTGTCDVEVSWWIFSKGMDINGTGMIGVYIDHSGNAVFTVRARSNAGGKNKGINVTWSKASGGDVDTKFY